MQDRTLSPFGAFSYSATLASLYWEFGSLLVFLLIGDGFPMLPESGTRRGRRGRLISTTVGVILVALSTYGYVVTTHAVMRPAVAQGVSVDAAGVPKDPCTGLSFS